MLEIIILGLLILLAAIAIVVLIVNCIMLFVMRKKKTELSNLKKRIKKLAIAVGGLCVISIVFVGITQLTAGTPDIKSQDGKESISQLKKVDINGRDEWISIRGYDRTKPVLLFLAGGPGGSQMAAVRHELSELEKSFVVVNWDQPGSGKSYSAINRSDLTKEIYIDDGIKLTEYLLDEFNHDKIYLLGESWGSALGIFMADERPDLYHAFIGTGQMVDFVETEVIDYNLALELAKESGDNSLVDKLNNNGTPPYYGKDVTWKSATYLNYLSTAMATNPEIHNGGFNTIMDLASSEYGIIDKINYLRGIVNTFNHVYPQLYDIDLREDYSELNIPVYFFLGRHDINAPLSLSEDYFDILDAPEKEIVWFENSGHNPWINEADKFVEELIKISEK